MLFLFFTYLFKDSCMLFCFRIIAFLLCGICANSYYGIFVLTETMVLLCQQLLWYFCANSYNGSFVLTVTMVFLC